MKSLRKMKTGYGPDIRDACRGRKRKNAPYIFIEIAQPNLLERYLVLVAQFLFMVFISSSTSWTIRPLTKWWLFLRKRP